MRLPGLLLFCGALFAGQPVHSQEPSPEQAAKIARLRRLGVGVQALPDSRGVPAFRVSLPVVRFRDREAGALAAAEGLEVVSLPGFDVTDITLADLGKLKGLQEI